MTHHVTNHFCVKIVGVIMALSHKRVERENTFNATAYRESFVNN